MRAIWMGLTAAGVLAGSLPFQAMAQPLADVLAERADAVLASALETGEISSARDELSGLRDQAVGYAPDRDLSAIMVTTRALLMARFADDSEGRSLEVLKALTEHPELASHLVFAWDRRRDDETQGGRVLVRLVEQRASEVDRFPALAAAVVLVHDVEGGLSRRVNENTARAADPIAIFDHFVQRERTLAISPKVLPTELLMHVVDTTSSAEDLAWAALRFGRRPEPGKRFFEIDYDYDHFLKGTEKKITASGRFDIQAIQELGGVCADQAYYAEEIGKACGVPTAYVVARGAEVGHAWIGFLELRGRRATWNLDAGRYDAYKNLRGNISVLGSQSTQSDSRLRLEAGLVGATDQGRWTAAAVSDSVWNWTQRTGTPRPASPEAADLREQRRQAESDLDMLALLRLGVAAAPRLENGWIVASYLGEQGRMDLKQLNEWGTALDRLCGREYADFSVAMLGIMIRGVESIEDQLEMWDWVHRRFGKRPDLAAKCRLTQARLSLKLEDREKAWWALMDVIDRYGGQTTEVVSAVSMAKQMLEENSMGEDVPAMLEKAWGKIPKPQQMAGKFRSQSNWYKVGAMYAASVERFDPGRADQIRKELNR